MWTLVFSLWLGAAGAPPAQEPLARAAVADIARDAPVEVRTTGRQKVRGRLGAVWEDGFEVRQIREGRVEAQAFSFNEVRSIRELSHPARESRVLLGVLVALGLTLALLLALAARLAD